MPLPGPPCCPAHKAVTRPSLPEQRSGLAKVTWPAQCLSPPPFRPEAVSSWRSWGCSRRGSPQRGPLFLPLSGSAAGSCLFRISYISSPSSLSNGHHRPWSPMVTKGDVGVPTGLGPFPVPLGGALLSALGSRPFRASRLADGPVRRLGLEAGAWHPGGPRRPAEPGRGSRSPFLQRI